MYVGTDKTNPLIKSKFPLLYYGNVAVTSFLFILNFAINKFIIVGSIVR